MTSSVWVLKISRLSFVNLKWFLKLWDGLFDPEVHGSKIALGSALAWLKDEDLLYVYLKCDAKYYAC